MDKTEDLIASLAEKYAKGLERKVAARIDEMQQDNLSHYLIIKC
jgi:hypothetical protein